MYVSGDSSEVSCTMYALYVRYISQKSDCFQRLRFRIQLFNSLIGHFYGPIYTYLTYSVKVFYLQVYVLVIHFGLRTPIQKRGRAFFLKKNLYVVDLEYGETKLFVVLSIR